MIKIFNLEKSDADSLTGCQMKLSSIARYVYGAFTILCQLIILEGMKITFNSSG